ncbi:MAG: type I-F CRISPR-associated protein Csy1 [Candidatus Cloacimonadota bacterium]|nr:type I-F CRISPR-associated protein Csy1 [Candidatus Cloacimonadota bacterium]
MLDKAIQDFLSDRKTSWLKKKIKANTTEDDKISFEDEAGELFSLEIWLPNAAKRAGQLSLVSHPNTFSHPRRKAYPSKNIKVSAIIAESIRKEDGFLRTGNAEVELDVFGNAAAIDVFKFLSLELSDGISILKHLEIESDKIKENFKIESEPFNELKDNFLAIKDNEEKKITSGKVKQVYFPVSGDYHLLSILTPSGLMYELRNRIQSIRFSEQTKEARKDKKQQVYNETGFDDLFNLTMIGYGGTKPQNISILNNANAGKTYLLPSIPPLLIKQNQRLPKNNFFQNSLWPKNFEEEFIALHKLFKADYNNKNIRDGSDRRIQSVIDKVIEKMWSIRLQAQGWASADIFSQLPIHQKIWLDDANKEERETNDEWLEKVINEFNIWIKYAYKKVIGRNAVLLADDELLHIKNIIMKNEEGLR